MYEPLFSILGPQAIEYAQTGTIQTRGGNRSKRTSPRNTYRTLDERWVALSGGTQQIANRMLEAIERADLIGDERFSSAKARAKHADELDGLIATWIARHDLETVLMRFRALEAPIAPVYDIAQIVGDAQYQARGSVVDIPDDDLGAATMAGIVPKLSRTPGVIRHAGRTAIAHDQNEVVEMLNGLEIGRASCRERVCSTV